MLKFSAALFSVIFLTIGTLEAETMRLSSPEFENNGYVPEKFTCRGGDVNPTLMIEGIPDGAKALALIVDDPDAPRGDWVHWVVFNIPVINRIEEYSIPGRQGVNDFGVKEYKGPCPPFGTHRYFFKIYALDAELDLEAGATKAELENAMEGHILGKAELIGLCSR